MNYLSTFSNYICVYGFLTHFFFLQICAGTVQCPVMADLWPSDSGPALLSARALCCAQPDAQLHNEHALTNEGVLHKCCPDFSQQTPQRHSITALPPQAEQSHFNQTAHLRQAQTAQFMPSVHLTATGGKGTSPSQWTQSPDNGLKVQFGSGFIQLKCLHISYLLYVFKCVIS